MPLVSLTPGTVRRSSGLSWCLRSTTIPLKPPPVEVAPPLPPVEPPVEQVPQSDAHEEQFSAASHTLSPHVGLVQSLGQEVASEPSQIRSPQVVTQGPQSEEQVVQSSVLSHAPFPQYREDPQSSEHVSDVSAASHTLSPHVTGVGVDEQSSEHVSDVSAASHTLSPQVDGQVGVDW